MEAAVGAGELEVFQGPWAQGLVEGERHAAVADLMGYDLREQVHLLAIDQAVQAQCYSLCHLALAQWVYVLRLTQVDVHHQLCQGVLLRHYALRLAHLAPACVLGLLHALHVVGQLHDDEGQLWLLESLSPAADEHAQHVGIWCRVAGVRLTLVPHHSGQRVGCQRAEHGIVEGGGQVLQADVAAGA